MRLTVQENKIQKKELELFFANRVGINLHSVVIHYFSSNRWKNIHCFPLLDLVVHAKKHPNQIIMENMSIWGMRKLRLSETYLSYLY